MNRQVLLQIDAFINLALGILLWVFPLPVASWMGIPIPGTLFYVNILGAVFIGIAIALLWEARRGSKSPKEPGLGVVGAAAINLCGGGMLGFWLLSGKLALTMPGLAALWFLVILLMGISVLELTRRGQTP